MRSIVTALAAFALTSGALAGDDCLWDNDLEPDGFNGRALSPPAFPDIRVADDFVITARDAEGWSIRDLHVTVIEDAAWVPGPRIEVTIYADGGACPGPAICRHVVPYERMATGDVLFDRRVYEYWAFFPEEKLLPRKYWVGHRNPLGAGSGTNYWLTSSGGGNPLNVGCFSLDAGATWQTEGAGWNHAFKITGSVNCTPCKGDINGDCFVDFDDLLQVLSGWGPCPGATNCPVGGTCEGGFPECAQGECLCFMIFEGSGGCLLPSQTCDAPECPGGSGDCPPGWSCYVETCCGVPTCAPDEDRCDNRAADAPPPAVGTRTFTGVQK